MLACSHHLHVAVLEPAVPTAQSQVFHELGGAHFPNICEPDVREPFSRDGIVHACSSMQENTGQTLVRHWSDMCASFIYIHSAGKARHMPAAYSDSIIDPTLYVRPCRCFPLSAPFPHTNLSSTACRAQRNDSFRSSGRTVSSRFRDEPRSSLGELLIGNTVQPPNSA